MIRNSQLVDVVNKLRQKRNLTIWCNPRGIFLSVHRDDADDGIPDVDARKFTHPGDLFDFLAEMAKEEIEADSDPRP